MNIATELTHKGIKWRLNPPSAPREGGIWERLVCKFKRILYTIIGTRRFTGEVLNPTFCLVEYATNARASSPVSTDPSDLDATSHNNFLFIGNEANAVPSVVGVDEFIYQKRYARAQFYANAIWSGWIEKYVPTLNRRSKWHRSAEQHLKTADLVWVDEDPNPMVTTLLLGSPNSVTFPTASRALPSCALVPDCSSAHL